MKEKILELRKQGNTYKQIQKEIGCSLGTISFHCGKNVKEKIYNRRKILKKLKLDGNYIKPLPIIKKEKVKRVLKEVFKKNCIICNLEFKTKRYSQLCCSVSCGQKNKNIRVYKEYIIKWLNKEISGGRGEETGHGCVSKHIRKYLFEKYSNSCSICKWSEINIFTNTIPLEVDHINGDSTNNSQENLTLVCPNCHSLTPGHSTNKGNGRRYFREKYYKEKNVGKESHDLS